MSNRPLTMQDVADRAGVSKTTVSHVINNTRAVSDELRSRVLQAMDELSYEPNMLPRYLRRNETCTIGLVVPNSANPFYAEVARGVESVGYTEGYSLFLCNSDRDLEKEVHYADLMLMKRVDGIIFVGAWSGEHIEHMFKLHERGIPIVAVDRNVFDLPVDSVVADNHLGGRQATEHLIQLGHKRIACIAGTPRSTPNAERLAGYKAALENAGLAYDDSLVVFADFQVDGGYNAATQLISGPNPPTAIFACNDLMAIGAMRSGLDAGLVLPDDLSIVGFDDIIMASYTNPSLTTILHPKREMGSRATTMLLERISENDLAPRRVVLSTQLIVRDSTDVLAK